MRKAIPGGWSHLAAVFLSWRCPRPRDGQLHSRRTSLAGNATTRIGRRWLGRKTIAASTPQSSLASHELAWRREQATPTYTVHDTRTIHTQVPTWRHTYRHTYRHTCRHTHRLHDCNTTPCPAAASPLPTHVLPNATVSQGNYNIHRYPESTTTGPRHKKRLCASKRAPIPARGAATPARHEKPIARFGTSATNHRPALARKDATFALVTLRIRK